VVATLARAVQQHPEVNARRAGRRLVLFDEVDLIVTVERQQPTVWVPESRSWVLSCEFAREVTWPR
jgi:hypothetical protein